MQALLQGSLSGFYPTRLRASMSRSHTIKAPACVLGFGNLRVFPPSTSLFSRLRGYLPYSEATGLSRHQGERGRHAGSTLGEPDDSNTSVSSQSSRRDQSLLYLALSALCSSRSRARSSDRKTKYLTWTRFIAENGMNEDLFAS